ncbi:hypothetical protein ACLGC9_02390 [Helicobacter pylori]
MKKELVISVIELVSKALHQNKASTRIRLLCGIIAETGANNYGLGLKRAPLNSMKSFFFVIWRKFCHFFVFDAFCMVLAHKKAFSVTTNKELDFAVISLKSTLLGRLPLMSEKVYFL